MSSRQNCQSRDIDEVSFDVRPHARVHGVHGDEIDALAEQVLEKELEIHVAIERRRAGKLDQHIDVAALAELIARRRAEQGERLDREPPFQLVDAATQAPQYFCSVHSLFFSIRAVATTQAVYPKRPCVLKAGYTAVPRSGGSASFSAHAYGGAVVLAHAHLHPAEVDDEGVGDSEDVHADQHGGALIELPRLEDGKVAVNDVDARDRDFTEADGWRVDRFAYED